MKDLKHTIFDQAGALPDEKPDLESFKQDFRKKQRKDYQESFRKLHKRLEIVLKLAEWKWLAKKALRYGMKPGPFLKAAGWSYLKRKYLLPDKKRLHDLELNLRRIGNNINQLVRRAHQDQQVELGMLNQMQVQLNDLENWVRHAFTSPQLLIDIVIREMRRSHHFRELVAEALIQVSEEDVHQDGTLEEEESGETTEVHRQ
ncbi:MAG: hypothetical protein AAF998_06865 [Bacteroidota bacterium]